MEKEKWNKEVKLGGVKGAAVRGPPAPHVHGQQLRRSRGQPWTSFRLILPRFPLAQICKNCLIRRLEEKKLWYKPVEKTNMYGGNRVYIYRL